MMTDNECDAMERAIEVSETRERERIANYLLPKLRKLSIADLRIIGRAFKVYGYQDMCKVELTEELAYCHGDDVCWRMFKVRK